MADKGVALKDMAQWIKQNRFTDTPANTGLQSYGNPFGATFYGGTPITRNFPNDELPYATAKPQSRDGNAYFGGTMPRKPKVGSQLQFIQMMMQIEDAVIAKKLHPQQAEQMRNRLLDYYGSPSREHRNFDETY